MRSYYILSAVGKDRPGIAADVSEMIYACGGNIEDSSMTLMQTHFALLLLFSTDSEDVSQKLSTGLKHLEGEKGLTVLYSQITFEDAHAKAREQTDPFKITTSGVDHAGIVFRVCRLLADRGINIVDMKTKRVHSAESGTPLFDMDIDVEVPRSVSEERLRDDLHHLANELVIDLVVRKRM